MACIRDDAGSHSRPKFIPEHPPVGIRPFPADQKLGMLICSTLDICIFSVPGYHLSNQMRGSFGGGKKVKLQSLEPDILWLVRISLYTGCLFERLRNWIASAAARTTPFTISGRGHDNAFATMWP